MKWTSGTTEIAQSNVPMTVGVEYTISCYAKGNGTLRIGYGGDSYDRKSISVANATSWELYQYTFTTTASRIKNGKSTVYFGTSTSGTMEICGMKLEIGAKATGWVPHALDSVDDRVRQAELKITDRAIISTVTSSSEYTALTQTASDLTTMVGDMTNNMTEIKQTANNIEATVTNMSVGSTQLLRGTNTTTELMSGGAWKLGRWRSASSTDAGVRKSIPVTNAPNPNIKLGWELTRSGTGTIDIAQNGVPVQKDQQYTLSCYAKGTGRLRMQRGAATGGYTTKAFDLKNVTEWTKYTYSYVAGDKTGDIASDGTTNIYFGISTDGTIRICGMKLETGNMATDWSPAPQDIDADIDNTRTELESKISVEAGKIAILSTRRSGSTQLLSRSKRLNTGSGVDRWRIDGSGVSVYVRSGTGFSAGKLTSSGLTENAWTNISSPLFQLPAGWYGRQITLSADLWSGNWTAVSHGFRMALAFSNNGQTPRTHRILHSNVIAMGKVELGAQGVSDTPLANSKWTRVSTTFRLNENQLDEGDAATFAACTHCWAVFYLVRNGDVRVLKPKLEFGNVATEWSEPPDEMHAGLVSITPDRIDIKSGGTVDISASGTLE